MRIFQKYTAKYGLIRYNLNALCKRQLKFFFYHENHIDVIKIYVQQSYTHLWSEYKEEISGGHKRYIVQNSDPRCQSLLYS